MKQHENLVVVIHLSATAVYAVVACVISKDDIQVRGMVKVNTNEFYQGRAVHSERLKKIINQAIYAVETMAHCRVYSIWLSFATPEMKSSNSHGKVVIDEETVSVKHIVEALGKAKEQDIANDHYVMQYAQQGILIDDDDMMVNDAIGTYADGINVMYHLLSLPVVTRQNMESLFRSTNVRVDHMVFDMVSMSAYALMPEEMKLGVCLLDIGYSTTNLCVYKEEKLLFAKCLPYGAVEVTMDISAELNLSMYEAERLKKRHGTVDTTQVDPAQFIEIKSNEDEDVKTISLHELALIIEARYQSILEQVLMALEQVGLIEHLTRGFVLAGGGSQMNGMVSFAKRYLQTPVVHTTLNKSITPEKRFDNEDNYAQLKSLIKERGFQVALGTLIYSQSEQFAHSQRSSPEALKQEQKEHGLMSRLGRFFHDFL